MIRIMGKKFYPLDLVKYALVLVLLIYIIIVTGMQGSSNTPFKTVQKATLATMDTKKMTKGDSQALKRFYGLSTGDYAGVCFYYSEDIMTVDEVLIVKLKDVEQSSEVESAIDSRIKAQKTSFQGYGTNQTNLLNHAIVEVRGNYILFAVSKKADATGKAFVKSL